VIEGGVYLMYYLSHTAVPSQEACVKMSIGANDFVDAGLNEYSVFVFV
jgi:hypothetical protein